MSNIEYLTVFGSTFPFNVGSEDDEAARIALSTWP